MGVRSGYTPGKPSAVALPTSQPTSSIRSGYKPQNVALPMSPADQKILSSFRSLPEQNRANVLNRLNRAAQAGDREAERKVAYLLPEARNNVPKETDYTDKSIGGRLYQAQRGITKLGADIGQSVIDSAVTTGKTLASAPHALNALGISAASVIAGQHGEKLAKSKQKALDELNKTPFGKYVGKTEKEAKGKSLTSQLAGIGGVTLENTLNIASLAGGGVPAGAKAVASSAGKKLVAKLAAKGEGGFIRDLASGQFSKTAVHPDDASIMAAFIDHARGIVKLGGKDAHRLELDASRIAEHYQIGGKAVGNSKLANAFDKVLSGSPEALRGIKRQSGRIGLPKGLEAPSGSLVKTGALYGAGYGAANAGKNNVTDPVELVKQVGLSAALGAAGGALPGLVGRAGDVKLGGASKLEKGLVDAPTPKRPPHQAKIEDAVNKGDMEEVARIIRAMPDNDPYKASMTNLFGDSLPKPIGHDVGEDILPREKAFDPSSRVKQYEESLQETIGNIEKDPAYLTSLEERGGGKVISNKETLAKAMAEGPLDEAMITSAKAGDKIDTVTLVRAKATVDAAAKDFTTFWKSKEWTPEQLQQRIEHLADLEAGYHVMSAEPGRATQIQSTFVDDAFKKAQKLKELLEGTKGPNREKLIDKELKEFEKSLEPEATKLFSKETAKNIIDAIEEYATAAKLTSPLTHAVNLTSNALTAPIKAAENLVSVGIGTVQGKTNLGQAKSIFGTWRGLSTAMKQLGTDLKQAVNPKAPDLKPDGTKIEKGPAIPGKAGKVIRTPFNLLQASDNFMKTLLRDTELNQRAYEKAYQEGFRKGDLTKRIAELLNDPTPEMTTRAEQVAKEFTYTSDPGPITEKIVGLVNAIPLGRLLVPFISTPTNIIKFQLQRHPVGVFAPRNLNALMKGSNLDRREAIARLTVGTGLATAGVMAAFNAADNITGAAPSDSGAKDLFYASGKKPYSIKVGDRWIQYNRFAPLGTYLTQAVGVRDKLLEIEAKNKKQGKFTDAGDVGSVFVALATSAAKGATELPFVSGVSSLFEALNDPSEITFNKLTGGALTGLIPNASRDVASGKDPVQREAKTVGEQVKTMVPGQRETLKPRIDVLGHAQVSQLSSLERGLVKITSKESNDPLYKELEKLGKETGYYPAPPKSTTPVNGKVLESADFTRYQALSGTKFATKLEKMLADSSFRNLQPEDKKRTLESALTAARKDAQEELFGKGEKKKAAKVKKY